MEIAPGIHRIKCLFGANRMVYVHLLVGEEAAMLVDTGCAHNPAQEILPYMHSIGFDPARLTYIVISHSDIDHQGGNAPMKAAAPQALLACHNLDRPWVEDTEALIRGRYSQFEARPRHRLWRGGQGGHPRRLSQPRARSDIDGRRALSPQPRLGGRSSAHAGTHVGAPHHLRPTQPHARLRRGGDVERHPRR